jgi:histidyl-tRNA synthetase
MHDLLPSTRAHVQHEFVSEKAIEIAQRYNYKPIRTPHVEFAGLFERTLGTTSDVIKKEMFLLKQNNELEGFDVQDNTFSSGTASEQIMCLRPEGTAGVVRSVIQHNLYNSRLFYMGSMYRYERPQKGRLRQFTQFGIERIGEKVRVP